MASCFGNSQSQNLTWYKSSTISNVTDDDPDHPEEFSRIAIGISPQVFYLSKKDANYSSLLEKANSSNKRNKAYDIGIENNTNIIKQINEIK